MTTGISVIVPAYNAEATLAAALDCIVRQTRQPLEVIVVDDGSTDRTAEIAQSYASRLPGLRVKSVTNGGVSRARNLAIGEARGEIVAPLDADDLWHETYLAKLCGRLEHMGRQAAFAYCFWRRVDVAGRVRGPNNIVAVDGMGFYRLLAYNYVGNGSNYVFWRHRLLEVGGYDETLPGTEDYLIQLCLAWRGAVGSVAERLVGYRDTPGSLSKDFRLMAECQLVGLQQLWRAFPQIDKREMQRAFSDAYLRLHFVVRAFGLGTPVESTKFLLLGLRYDPLRFFHRLAAALAASLTGRTSAPAAPFEGDLFADVDPGRNYPTSLPSFTRIRIRDAEQPDHRRARDLGLEPPPPPRLSFSEQLA